MTKEKERHDQANDLVEITDQTDTQISVDLTPGESAPVEVATESANESDENPVIPTEQSANELQNTDNQKVYSEEDMQKLVEEAYLKGKNEAVKVQIERDTAMRSDDSSRRHVGLERYFIGRASVWR